MTFAALWMDLEIVILSKAEKEKCMISHKKNLKNGSNKVIYKEEFHMQKVILWFTEVKEDEG